VIAKSGNALGIVDFLESILDTRPLFSILASHTPRPFARGGWPVEPLEQLFAMEVEYHRRLRCEVRGDDAVSLPTSPALQSGYDPLLRGIGHVSPRDIEWLADRFILTGDARDVLNARESLARLLNPGP
jgi:hypothetical protein